MRFYSGYIQRDPAMSRTLIRTFERRMGKLFKRFRKDALEALPGYRMNAATKINFADLSDHLLFLIETDIGAPGKSVMLSLVEEAMKAGKTRASALLKAAGVQAVLGDVVVNPLVKETLYKRNLALLKGITEDMGKNIQVQLSEGILKGEGMSKLAKRLVESTGIAEDRAKLIARTETMFAFNTAAKEEYQRYGVEKVEWVAALDERMCDICGKYHGKIYPIDAVPDAPAHPNCRCVKIPYIEEVA
ncbi:MAG TPA: minor capsid protein [Methanomassiliicoccaceae archaeon]|nr:minor capsid protein [Methanomassiliicoccaceae archaeon]